MHAKICRCASASRASRATQLLREAPIGSYTTGGLGTKETKDDGAPPLPAVPPPATPPQEEEPAPLMESPVLTLQQLRAELSRIREEANHARSLAQQMQRDQKTEVRPSGCIGA